MSMFIDGQILELYALRGRRWLSSDCLTTDNYSYLCVCLCVTTRQPNNHIQTQTYTTVSLHGTVHAHVDQTYPLLQFNSIRQQVIRYRRRRPFLLDYKLPRQPLMIISQMIWTYHICDKNYIKYMRFNAVFRGSDFTPIKREIFAECLSWLHQYLSGTRTMNLFIGQFQQFSAVTHEPSGRTCTEKFKLHKPAMWQIRSSNMKTSQGVSVLVNCWHCRRQLTIQVMKLSDPQPEKEITESPTTNTVTWNHDTEWWQYGWR